MLSGKLKDWGVACLYCWLVKMLKHEGELNLSRGAASGFQKHDRMAQDRRL